MSDDEISGTNTDSDPETFHISPPDDADREATIVAIREALADVRAGRTRPAFEALREIAMKFDIPVPPE